MENVRTEHDTLGEVEVPQKAYYGAQTVRAVNNFPISGLLPARAYVFSTVLIKKAAAIVNRKLGLLPDDKMEAIVKACDEILAGEHSDQFVVDPYQAGAGTSHNMNANEVIANRANEIMGAPLGSYRFIHPNDDVNMSQSTNDIIPVAIRLTVLKTTPALLKNLSSLSETFSQKAQEFADIIKSGRTHLQDALPVTLGAEFSAYARALENDIHRIERAAGNILQLGIGGTAVGTGINSHVNYHKEMVDELKNLTGFPLKTNDNLFEAMQNTADFLDFSSSLRILSQTLVRIGNDLRLLSFGPRAGLAEIILPKAQPGSSIMPGKVNPSIIEMTTMVCFQVIGYDQAVLLACQAGQLELNVMMPLIAFDLPEQIKLLTNAIEIFNTKCVSGIEANEEMCRFWFERSAGIAAILNTFIGYEKTAEIVNFALKNNISIKEAVLGKKYLPKETIEDIFKVENLTRPQDTKDGGKKK
jgi:fumarate hydratase class II